VRIDRGKDTVAFGREWWRLAGECELDELISWAPQVAREYMGNRQARALSGTRAGEETLEAALDGLERCDFVGLTEKLGESVDWLTRRLGWRSSNLSRGRM
jgi:hypothetical protein